MQQPDRALDIPSARINVEETLRRQYLQKEALSSIVAALLVEKDPQAAVENLARQVMAVLDCQAFFNFLYVPEKAKLQLNACAGIPPEEAERITWLDLGVAVCGCVARDGHRIIAEDIQHTTDPRTDLVKSYGIRAYACHPLLSAGGTLIGTLSFGTRTRDRFSEEDIAFMKTVTDHIAIAMERKRTSRELERMNEMLEQRVAERTQEAHRMADQLRALASEVSQAEQRERIRLATLLHDHIQQLIAAARLQLEAIDPEGGLEQQQSSLRALGATLKEALEASRNLAVEISPPILKQAGLFAAIRWLADRMAQKDQFAVELQIQPDTERLSEEMRFLVFACVRELLLNALKHSGARSAKLTVSDNDNAHMAITVEDQGTGFDPGLLTKDSANTAVFGLFSIQQRLAHVGGAAEIDSSPGHGTRVRILAPLAEAAPEKEHRSEQPAPRVQGASPAERTGRCRVMIVDDHKIMREGLSGLLRQEQDMEIVGEAADGAQAVELAQKLSPDVIVMDINLGEMSGIEATRIIVQRNPRVKVVGLSMHVDSAVAQSMRDAGAVGYLSKGGPSADLVGAIRSCSAAL